MLEVDLEAVVGPGAELHEAGLLVEGEVAHVDLAGGLEDGRRRPEHLARVVEDRLGHGRHPVLAVRAAHRQQTVMCSTQIGRASCRERV